jgi:hypothetical protein
MGFCRGNASGLLELQPYRPSVAVLYSLKKVFAKLFILKRDAEPLSSVIFKTGQESRMFSWTGRRGLDPPRLQQFQRLNDRSWRVDRKDDQPGNPEREPAGHGVKSVARALPSKLLGSGRRLIYSLRHDLIGFGFRQSPEHELRRESGCQPQVKTFSESNPSAVLDQRGGAIAKISKGERTRHVD